MGIGEELEQLGPSQLGAGLVLDGPRDDRQSALGGKGLELVPHDQRPVRRLSEPKEKARPDSTPAGPQAVSPK
jgi:hypothetical protein